MFASMHRKPLCGLSSRVRSDFFSSPESKQKMQNFRKQFPGMSGNVPERFGSVGVCLHCALGKSDNEENKYRRTCVCVCHQRLIPSEQRTLDRFQQKNNPLMGNNAIKTASRLLSDSLIKCNRIAASESYTTRIRRMQKRRI